MPVLPRLRRAPLVQPEPPRVRGRVPFVRGGIAFLSEPTDFLRRAREQHGDTFLLEAFGFTLLMTFSSAGLKRLYAAPEDEASFTEATRTLIGFKLPPALIEGDMQLFHKLFTRERVAGYLEHTRAAVHEDIATLGPEGVFECFARMKQLVHRIGFRCWVGPEAGAPRYLSRLQSCFERLDPEEAFVRPHRIFWTLLTRKAPERRALREVEAILREIWEARRRSGARHGDLMESLLERHAALPERQRMARVAADVMLLHLASLSNLYAAMAWTLVNVISRPSLRAEVTRECEALAAEDALTSAALDRMEVLDSCAHESIRFAQRSITLRRVLTPCRLDDGEREYTLQPGVFLATMLSVTNTESDELARFDPAHYARGRLAPELAQDGRERVSTFGHGIHSCPGQRFAIAVIKLAIAGYLTRLELDPLFAGALPKRGQLGAIARSETPCRLRYRARAT